MRIKQFFTLGLFILAGVARAEVPLSNLNVTAALDLVSPIYTSDAQSRGFNVIPRAAEFVLYGPVDHLFDGVINFAGHTEDGEFHFELHEGYLGSTKLIDGSRFKVGKFFLGIGRLNQYHQHDWNFIDAPRSHEEFFADEGVADTGVEYTYLLPADRFFELTAGVASGYCYGHCHDSGEKPLRPILYVHPVTFFEISDHAGLQLGISYLNRKDHDKTETHLAGFDLAYKERIGKRLKWLHETEGYFESQKAAGADAAQRVGGYHFTQFGISPEWLVGARLDAFSDLSKSFITTGESRADFDYGVTAVGTWKPSEFALVRFSYGVDVDTTEGDESKLSQLAKLQFIYILGAHPAHDF